MMLDIFHRTGLKHDKLGVRDCLMTFSYCLSLHSIFARWTIL